MTELSEVFSSIPATQLLDEPPSDGRLLIIDFVADWCGPCHQMDRSTWPDGRLASWIKDHAIAVKVDVDKEPAVKERFKISAMPTIMAVRDGEEVERVIGARPASAMLTWLEGLLTGETELDRLRAAVAANPDKPVPRMQVARHLLMTGQHEEALAEFLWMWDHGAETYPNFQGPKVSFLAADLGRLVALYPPARAEVQARRDALEPGDDPGAPRVAEWLALNDALQDVEAPMAWYDSIKSKLATAPAPALANRFHNHLRARARWDDLLLLYPDPAAAIAARASAPLPPAPEEQAKVMAEARRETLLRLAADLITGLEIQGRQPDAARVEEALRNADVDTSDVDTTIEEARAAACSRAARVDVTTLLTPDDVAAAVGMPAVGPKANWPVVGAGGPYVQASYECGPLIVAVSLRPRPVSPAAFDQSTGELAAAGSVVPVEGIGDRATYNTSEHRVRFHIDDTTVLVRLTPRRTNDEAAAFPDDDRVRQLAESIGRVAAEGLRAAHAALAG